MPNDNRPFDQAGRQPGREFNDPSGNRPADENRQGGSSQSGQSGDQSSGFASQGGPSQDMSGTRSGENSNLSPVSSSGDLNDQGRSARGTAAMDPGTRKEVARKGGLAVSRNRAHMAEIGRKGGQSVSRNREHMAKIGRKGGAASRGHRGSGGSGGEDSGFEGGGTSGGTA